MSDKTRILEVDFCGAFWRVGVDLWWTEWGGTVLGKWVGWLGA